MKLMVKGFSRGAFVMERGSLADYRALEHLHYVRRRPAVVVGVWRVRFRPAGSRLRRLAAVGVLCFPTLECRAREAAIGLDPVRKIRRNAPETVRARRRRIQRKAERFR